MGIIKKVGRAAATTLNAAVYEHFSAGFNEGTGMQAAARGYAAGVIDFMPAARVQVVLPEVVETANI